MRRRSGLLGQESGQGTIEYILLLVISVIVILGLLYQFNRAFKDYTIAYFGNYISCLLEVGELPGAVACESDIATFDFKSAKPLVTGQMGRPSGPGGGGGSSGSSSNTDSKNSKDDSKSQDAAAKSAQKTAAANGQSGSSTGETVASSSGSGSGAIGSFGKSGRERAIAVGTLSKESSALGDADSLLGTMPNSTSVGTLHATDRSRAGNLTWGYYGDEEQKERAISRPASSAVTTKPDTGQSLKGKAAQETVTRAIASQQDSGSDGFSFSGMIRLILIIVMLIAIIIFFGGQLLQMSKSGEK
jgi:hypothetical protein